MDLKLTYEDLKLDLYGLELKLHMVHLAVNFSEAKLVRLRRTWLPSVVYRVQFKINVNKEEAKYTKPSLQGKVYCT